MARDSLFGETILWSGRPKGHRVPTIYVVAAVVGAIVSVVSVCFAVVVATTFRGAHVGSLVFFAAWCATIALAAWQLPLLWRTRVEYLVTDKHVIWRRGPLRRSIGRDAISYARIRWSPSLPGVGDLVVVRAVPTGALRRTLSLTLSDVEAPDRLWALVRGIEEPSQTLGDGARPLGQRLDEGERVLWTAVPMASSWPLRRLATAALGLVLAIASIWMVVREVPSLRRVVASHALAPAGVVTLFAGVLLGSALLIAVAAWVSYSAWIRPGRLVKATRYLITDKRVLICRADEELHLDRGRIAYVIEVRWRGLYDVYLVLDGPRARALAPSGAFGAFGASDESLVPVLGGIEDGETVAAILRGDPRVAPMADAAE